MNERLPTIRELVELIARERELSPSELLARCLKRIEARENEIHAWVFVDVPGAQRQAKELESRLARGDATGRLFGIPIGIKDIVNVAGLPNEAGSPLRKGFIAQSDAPLVTRLRAEGAIILGKTVTTEFASFDPPPTRNPWNLAHTPGGSSSGSAAAVATGMCLGAVGSQTGGSIIRPASYCGVAGLKPRWGVLPLDGVVPLSHHLDHPGPIARNVADLATLFLAMRGEANGSMQLAPQRHFQLVVLDDFFAEADAHAVGAAQAALEKLRFAGAVVSHATLPIPLADVLRAHRQIMAVEAAQYHRPWFPERRSEYGPNIAALLDEGHALSAVEYAEALATQRQFRRAFAESFGCDAILASPSTLGTAPTAETTGNPKLNSPWSMAGCAALSLLCGRSPDGMPLGLQFATTGDEQFLLAAGQWCESVLVD